MSQCHAAHSNKCAVRCHADSCTAPCGSSPAHRQARCSATRYAFARLDRSGVAGKDQIPSRIDRKVVTECTATVIASYWGKVTAQAWLDAGCHVDHPTECEACCVDHFGNVMDDCECEGWMANCMREANARTQATVRCPAGGSCLVFEAGAQSLRRRCSKFAAHDTLIHERQGSMWVDTGGKLGVCGAAVLACALARCRALARWQLP